MRRRSRSFGESILEEGVISSEQLKTAQAEEKRSGQNLRKVLIRMGMISEEVMITFLSDKLGIPKIDLNNYIIDPKLTALVPEDLARKYEVIPVLKIGNRLTCAMIDPWNVIALDELRARTQLTIEPAVATESEIRKALEKQYGAKDSIEKVIQSVEREDREVPAEEETDLEKVGELADEPSVKKIVNLTIMNAVHQGASDIHLEPEEKELKVRYRVDGMMHYAPSLPKHVQSAVISRIKILSSLDITERRMAQDGRFNIRMGGREIDVRTSCVPTMWGENVVLRLLDATGRRLKLNEVGFAIRVRKHFEGLIRRPHGIILVTGPTGSGKTTTLYASLDHINSVEKNIITIEDPVEYRLPGIRQVQVNNKVKLNFANGLRSILRQDPDIIMVGEVRDAETAKIAVNAAQTGHLVLSTLHTNDAAGAVTRLIDMGVEPFLISSSLMSVVAQRLVRRICDDCKESYKLPAAAAKQRAASLKAEKIEPTAYRGKGCSQCLRTGFKGRLAIFEMISISEEIKRMILAKSSSDEIRRQAVSEGMLTLQQDGLQKTLDGLTTVEEVLRVTQDA